jgi:UDP-4-amino-4,6-dideoxy-N-acetyl-beta-L-altrosamine N-acetyltransferase
VNSFLQYKLRPMLEADLSVVFDWRNSERIRANMYSDELISWDNHCRWFSRIQSDESCSHYIVEYMEEPVGVVNFTDINHVHHTCNWGFYIGDENAPRGSGTALGILALTEAFERLNMRKVCGEVFSFNEASIRFHQKLGFKQEGYLAEHVMKSGQYEDIVLFAHFSEPWQVAKEKLVNTLTSN